MVKERLLSELPDLVERSRVDAAHLDAMPPGKKVNRLMDRISEAFFKRFSPNKLEGLAGRVGQATSDFQKKDLERQVRAALGIDLNAVLDAGLSKRMAAFTAENVALIKSIPNQYFDQVEKTVIAGMRSGIRHEEIAKDIEERFEVSKSRAALIARDQVGKWQSELDAARQQQLGVTRFIWRTVHDERVRPEHQALDGEVFSYDDPPSEGLPGTPINCRCYAEPVFEDLFAQEAPAPKERFSPDRVYMRPLSELEDVPALAWNPSRTPDIVRGFKEGAEFPPIVIGSVNGERDLIDGNHRLWVARQLGIKEIPVKFASKEAFQGMGPLGREHHMAEIAEANWANFKGSPEATDLWKKSRKKRKDTVDPNPESSVIMQ